MKKDIEELRCTLDRIDEELVGLLSERTRTVREIGARKRDAGIPAYDAERWQEVKRTRADMGERKGVPRAYIEEVYEVIHRGSVALQEEQK